MKLVTRGRHRELVLPDHQFEIHLRRMCSGRVAKAAEIDFGGEGVFAWLNRKVLCARRRS